MTKANVRGIDFGTGAEQVNSRTIPANFTPTNYTPSQVAAEGTDKLSAHLKGIDNAIVAGGPLAVVQAGGDTVPLTGLSASTSNDNVISGLPNGHGIEVGDRISVTTTVDVTFINYRTYGNQVIEIQNDLFSYVQVTDVVPAGLNGTYDLEVDVDGGGLTAVSFLISPGDTWADVVSAVSSGLTTASLAATAFFNSPSTLWAGGVSNANPGILIRSNTLGTGSSIGINNGSVNDFLAALSAESYSSNIYSNDDNGNNFDLALSTGFTFAAGTYSVSGPIYTGTFGIAFAPFVGVGILSAPLSPDLFTTGYTTQNTGDLSNDTAAHSMPGGSLTGTVSISNANDITYVGTPITIASITALDRIRKHYIENGNIGIGTDEPQYPFDVVADLHYKGNRFKKVNFDAISAPTSSDDSTQGYEVGSTWIYDGQVYVCTNASAGNASWNAGSPAVTSVNGDFGPAVTLTTNNIGEASNLYYTDTRFDNRLATKTTDNLPEGSTNLYFSGRDTDDLPEGTTNLYFSGKDTDDLSEGSTNKYVTQAQKNEFHTNHTNRTSLDLLQFTSPISGDLVAYDSGVSKFVNQSLATFAPQTLVRPRDYMTGLDYAPNSFLYLKRNYPFSSNRRSHAYRYASANYGTICFYGDDYVFAHSGGTSWIYTKTTAIAASSQGIVFTTPSDVFRVSRDYFYVSSGHFIRLTKSAIEVRGTITPPAGRVIGVFQQESISNVPPFESPSNAFYIVTIEGNGTATPVFKSYSANFTTSVVTLVSTINYTSLTEYDAAYTEVTYVWDNQGLVVYPDLYNNYWLYFRIAATGWDGSQLECWAREVRIVVLSGTLTFTSGINGKVVTGGAQGSPTFFSQDLLMTEVSIDTRVYSYTSLNTNTYITQSLLLPKCHPVAFPTAEWPKGYICIFRSGVNPNIRYIDANTLEDVAFTPVNSPQSYGLVPFYASMSADHSSLQLVVQGDLFLLGAKELSLAEYAPQTATLFAHTAAGYGSTAIKIPYFSTATISDQANRFSVVNDSTDGLSVRFKVKGIYAITYWYDASAAEYGGISLNASSVATDVTALAATQRIQLDRVTAAGIINVSTEVSVEVGDIVRPHNTGVSAGTAANCGFRVEFIRATVQK